MPGTVLRVKEYWVIQKRVMHEFTSFYHGDPQPSCRFLTPRVKAPEMRRKP
jgi:hypothetical protein